MSDFKINIKLIRKNMISVKIYMNMDLNRSFFSHIRKIEFN